MALQLPPLAERRQQLQDAAARAEAANDQRPYPVGWPTGTLPLHREPEITRSIVLGQTMREVAQVMGREGWSFSKPRAAFLDNLRKIYGARRSTFKAPEDPREVIERLPAQGQFVWWEYQGFPSTADWVVVLFASSDANSGAELRVVARGVFGLGCF